jgi:RHS repeat-associated protein
MELMQMRNKHIALILLSFLFVSIASAQNYTNPPGALDGHPYQTYNFDSIDAMTGNLLLDIPLISFKQKGNLSVSYSLRYSNKQLFEDSVEQESGCQIDDDGLLVDCTYTPAYYWSYAYPDSLSVSPRIDQDAIVYTSGFLSYYYAGADGPSPESGDLENVYTPDGSSHMILQATTGEWRSADSSGFVAPVIGNPTQGETGYWVPGTTIDQAGNTHWGYSPAYTFSDTQPANIFLADTQGNQITFNKTTNSLTDTAGRTLPYIPMGPGVAPTSDSSSSGTVDSFNPPGQKTTDFSGCTGPLSIYNASILSFPGENGGSVPYKLCYVIGSLQTNFQTPGQGVYEDGTVSEVSGQVLLLQSVVLPNNTTWTFEYNSRNQGDPGSINYLDLTKVTLPTGGNVSYTWGTNSGGNCGIGFVSSVIEAQYYCRVLLSRTEDPGGNSQTWNYTYTSPQNIPTTEIDSPASNFDGSKTITTETFNDLLMTQSLTKDSVTGKVLNEYDLLAGVGFGGEVWDAGGSLIGYTGSELPTDEVNITDGVSREEHKTQYSATMTVIPPGLMGGSGPDLTIALDKPTQIIQYDYSGAVLQQANTAFAWQSNSSIRSANMLDLPAQQTIYDGSGNIAGQTTYTYDATGTQPGTTMACLPAGGAGVGNLCNVARVTGLGPSITTNYQYNSTGQRIASKDSNGNVTNIAYDSTGVFPSELMRPATNGISHNSWTSYDRNSGLLVSSTDENGSGAGDPAHTTRYSYDNMKRVTGVTLPPSTTGAASGGTSYCYTDLSNSCPSGAIPNSVYTVTDAAPDPNIANVAVYDGLGREVQHATLSAPGGTLSTETAYDPVGRVASVSNLHSTSPSNTDGLTTYAYDALGRKVYQCNPDNGTGSSLCAPGSSYLSWTYNGSQVTAADELRNPTQQTTDALGRLVQVVEPGALITNYSYDALGNLLTVIQRGASSETPRTRSFNYDSLSRLHCASNPENSQNPCPTSATTTLPSGVTSYIYDANGNVTSKTDARGVTTSYHYDGLNRLIQKSYNDGVTNTNLYGYDSSSVGFVPVPQNGRGDVSVSLVNTIGRLAYASSTNSGTLDAFSYDAMGRLVNQWSTTPSFNNNNGTVAAITAGYDLAGNLTSLTYPDGRKVSQIIDGAGRVSSVNYAAWNATAHTGAYLAVTNPGGYDAAGHLVSATLGNGVGIGAGYDNRERISQLVYGSTAQMLWGKQYQWTTNSNLQGLTDRITGTQRQFSYDNLNRLTSAQDILGSTPETTPPPPSSGPASGLDGSGGATPTPSWTDPDDSNVLINPETPGANGWILSDVTIASSPVAAPDGSLTAYNVTSTDPSNSYVQDQVADPSQYVGETMSGSIWLRSPNGPQTVNLYLTEPGAVNGGYGVAASKQVTVTTTWQQFQLSGQFQSGYSSLVLQIGSPANNQTLSLWGAMMQDMGSIGVDVTNYLPNSQRFTASTWLGNAITPSDNTATAPDGTNTASTLTASTGSTDSHIEDVVPNPAAFSGQPVTGSVWMRSVAGTQNILLTLFEVGAGDAPGGYSTIGSNAVALTSNWQRFQVSGTTLNTLSQLLLQVGGAGTFTSGSIQVWGAQLELASTAGPYVATGATAVSAGTNLTNLLPYSQQPNGTSWSPNNASISLNSTSAPDGTSTAATVTAVAGSSDTFTADFVQNPALYNNQKLTASVYLRAASGTQNINLYLLNVGTGGWAAIATSTVTLTTSWQRFSVTGTSQNGLTSLYLQIGGGGTITSGQSYQVWGAQMQLGSTVGPYVATSALPVLAGQELTNILPNSQGMNGPAWSVANGSAAANTGTAPDGTNTAATVTATASSPDTYTVANVPNPSLYDGETVTVSVYARVASGTLNMPLFILNTGDSGWTAAAETPFTLTTTWQRFSVTGTLQNGLTQLYMQLGGDGAVTSGKSFQVWGAQLVVGSDPAPYTPTSSGTTNVATSAPATLAPNGLNENYSYDSFGNILQKGSFTASYTANNQLTNGVYDAAGNLLSNYLSPMTWDAENRLISVGGATYFYDANGNRVEKQGVGVTDTVYFGGRPVARFSAGQWTDLIYGPNGMLGEVAGSENADTAYRLLDHLGTEVGTVDSTGIMTNPLDYTPFGQIFSGSTNDPYLFTGKERDAESGLDYFGARYYGSNMGRFMSPDWSGADDPVPYASLDNPQTLNLYSYVQNNPLTRVDPFGHQADPCATNPNCVTVTADGPPLLSLTQAWGHHFIDRAIVAERNAQNSLAGQFARLWRTGGPLKTPGVHTGFPKQARLSQEQVRGIINKVEELTGKPMSSWDAKEINMAAEEIKEAGGDTGKFLSDIAAENPTLRTVNQDWNDVLTAAGNALQRIQASSAAKAVGGAIQEGEEACQEIGCQALGPELP